MKPKYWNKGIIYLSKKDLVLKKLIQTYKNEHINLNYKKQLFKNGIVVGFQV